MFTALVAVVIVAATPCIVAGLCEFPGWVSGLGRKRGGTIYLDDPDA